MLLNIVCCCLFYVKIHQKSSEIKTHSLWALCEEHKRTRVKTCGYAHRSAPPSIYTSFTFAPSPIHSFVQTNLFPRSSKIFTEFENTTKFVLRLVTLSITNTKMDVKSMKSKIDQACRTAEEFTKLYYETIDKRRHLISKLYLDNGLLTWNGNGVNNSERIQKFYIDLPTSDHTIVTIDSQPILDSAVNGQLTFLIQTSGTVKYQDKIPKTFQQSFVVTALGDKWKIVNDCFRLQEPLNEKNT